MVINPGESREDFEMIFPGEVGITECLEKIKKLIKKPHKSKVLINDWQIFENL